MRTFELFGHGIGYTASPLIHHAALTHLGVADRYDYVVTDVSPADFPRALQRFRRDGEGANVTIPLKALAAAGCDALSEDARLLDAANTIVRDGERLAQLVPLPLFPGTIELVEDLEDHARGSNGFGSSGV